MATIIRPTGLSSASPMIRDVGHATPVTYTRGRGDGWRP